MGMRAMFSAVAVTAAAAVMWNRGTIAVPESPDAWGLVKGGPHRKVVVVTGSNTGVGYETARRLALGGFEVVLACRNTEKAAAAAAAINAEIKASVSAAAAAAAAAAGAGAGGHVRGGVAVPMQLDLAEFASVRRFAAEFLLKYPQLHVLVANAGLNTPLQSTVDGLNTVFQVNYLSHFLLLQLLLPTLVATGGGDGELARVVLLSSVTQHIAPGDYASSTLPFSAPAYRDSKLAMSALAEECQTRNNAGRTVGSSGGRRLLPVQFIHANPGAVNSDIWRSIPYPFSVAARAVFSVLFLDTTQGAETSVHAAVGPEFGGSSGSGADDSSGDYGGSSGYFASAPYLVPYSTQYGWPLSEAVGPFAGSVPGRPAPFVNDAAHRSDLYALSLKLTAAPDALHDLLSTKLQQ